MGLREIQRRLYVIPALFAEILNKQLDILLSDPFILVTLKCIFRYIFFFLLHIIFLSVIISNYVKFAHLQDVGIYTRSL